MYTTNKQNNQRFGFTLIELLVVIAIIAILAAILFPVFAKVREKARQTACLSNEKQQTLGMLQYVQDYDDTFPRVYGNGSQTNLSDTVGWADAIQPYIKSTGVFHCPDDPSAFTTQPWSTNYSSYAANGSISLYNSAINAQSGQTESVFYEPTLTILILEQDTYNAANYMPWYLSGSQNGFYCGVGGSGPILYQRAHGDSNCQAQALSMNVSTYGRHTLGANYGFADGHVKWCRPDTIYGNNSSFTNSGQNPTFDITNITS